MLPCDPNLPIGIESVWQFSWQNTILEPQSSIFLYTDGLNEAENINHAQFGNKRILKLATELLAKKQYQPQPLIEQMTEAVHQFVGHAEQSDDLTMLAIQWKNN
jgi:sigma-B regulation protein RsbU (phosphoserine phosphatase)